MHGPVPLSGSQTGSMKAWQGGGGGLEWQLIVDAPAPAERNMARDIEFAERAAREAVGFLRIYGWSPPAISIGRNQSPAQACDLAACAAQGWDVVRRPTGGRAVLHAGDEVTYSVMLPLHEAPAGVLAAYEWLAGGLLCAYRLLGLPAELSAGRRLTDRTGACFDAPAAHEIVCGGRKVAGSAQVRRGGYLLQHGSLPVRFDPELHARLLGLPSEAARLLARRAAGIADLCDPVPSRADIVAAVVQGFRQAVGLDLPNFGRGVGGEPSGIDIGHPRSEPQPARPA